MPIGHRRILLLLALIGAASCAGSAAAQQLKPSAEGAKAPAGAATAPIPSNSAQSGAGARANSDAAKKAAILASPDWRRMIFELNEWFSVQPFYDAKKVQQIKNNISAAVAKMSASDLEFMLQDMNAKFKIINSDQAKEARDWLGHYLSLVTDKRRDEVLKELPNLATMTAAQLNQEVRKIEQQRAATARSQSSFDKVRQAQVDHQLAADRSAQQALARQQSQAPSSYYSPYRNPNAGGKPPFSDVKTGPSMEYYIGSYGRFGVIYNPSSY